VQRKVMSLNDNPNFLQARVNELRAEIRKTDPHILAGRTGANYEARDPQQGAFAFDLWGNPMRLTFPALILQDAKGNVEPNVAYQALVMYYFHTADGAARAYRWIAFSELPDGRFYSQAFQGYTGGELARVFHNQRQAFEDAARRCGGERLDFGDAAFAYDLLPRVSLLAVMWEGDEDFPPSYKILFDAAAGHYLPTDACAIAGSMLSRRLIAARQ